MPPKNKTNDEYEEKDLRTHIYENSDTYAGSDQMIKANLPSMGDEETTISFKDLEYITVTYKCFDEIIVNAGLIRERLRDKASSIFVATDEAI